MGGGMGKEPSILILRESEGFDVGKLGILRGYWA